jgi:hypothetical protein
VFAGWVVLPAWGLVVGIVFHVGLVVGVVFLVWVWWLGLCCRRGCGGGVWEKKIFNNILIGCTVK